MRPIGVSPPPHFGRGCVTDTGTGTMVSFELICRAAGEQVFSGVGLMDLQMPKLDGVDAMRRIRLRAGFEQLPVGSPSGEINPFVTEEALDAGMADFVQKPFNIAELTTRLAPFRPSN